MLKIGDQVSVLNETTTGKVVGIKGNHILIETPDGFELPYLKKELVVYQTLLDLDKLTEIPQKSTSKISSAKPKKNKAQAVVDLHFEAEETSNHPVLGQQIIQFKSALNLAIRAGQSEITFIHGVGAGKLRAEIEKILHKQKISFSDGAYAKYGTRGAILVHLQGIKKMI